MPTPRGGPDGRRPGLNATGDHRDGTETGARDEEAFRRGAPAGATRRGQPEDDRDRRRKDEETPPARSL